MGVKPGPEWDKPGPEWGKPGPEWGKPGPEWVKPEVPPGVCCTCKLFGVWGSIPPEASTFQPV